MQPVRVQRGARVAARATAWRARVAAASVLTLAVWIAGCQETSAPAPNQPPQTFLTAAPRDSSRVAHHVEFLYHGRDNDGTTAYYEYFLRTYPRTVSNMTQVVARLQTPAPNDPGWTRVNVARVELAVAADTLRADPRGDIGSGEFDRWHTFYVRAVDNEGAVDDTPEWVSFDAFTIAPRVWLENPVVAAHTATLPRTFVMNWNGVDEVGGTAGQQNVLESRWVLRPAALDGTGQPIGFPEQLYGLQDSDWSPWVRWSAPDSTGRQAEFHDKVAAGGGEVDFVFAVQGRDDGGAVTPKFQSGIGSLRDNNYAVLRILGTLPAGPTVKVHAREDTLSSWSFTGDGAQGATTPEDSLNLYWDRPTAQSYGASAREARYGWNIVNLSDAGEWTEWSTSRTAAPHQLANGDIFYIECRDDLHPPTVTRGRIQFQRIAR